MKKYFCPIQGCSYSWLDKEGWKTLYMDHLRLNHSVEEVKKSLIKAAEKK